MTGATKLGLAVAAVSIILLGGVIVWDQQKNATGEEPMGMPVEVMADRSHIPVGSPRPDYNSDPPTSGPHYAEPASWGVYEEVLLDEQLVHNLEHGEIVVYYRPDLVDETVMEQFRTIQRSFPRKSLFVPRPQARTAIVLTSWGYLLELDEFDEQAVREFIRRNKNRAPEFFPD
jgi:hypothetical protein